MIPVLVVGGAGYIGSHTCLGLAEKGFQPIVYDNLANGHAEFVRWGPLERGDIRDGDRLGAVLAAHRPQAIVHFASLIEVGRSTIDPISFYDNNVSGSICLLKAALRADIDKLVFSSTCATYGLPETAPLSETHPQKPINPYGRTKLQVEEMIGDLSCSNGLNAVILRYFNAAGADPEGRIGEWHDPETHAIPLAVHAALGRREAFTIFGEDYDTPDGTCVRDYVHVQDLADAHVRAVQYLLEGGTTTAVNLGTGRGTSVKEMLKAIEQAGKRAVPVRAAPRRLGDSPKLVADNALAHRTLGWKPRHDFTSIIETAWRWHESREISTVNKLAKTRSS